MRKYWNYRNSVAECDEGVIFCCDNPDDSSHYGNIQRVFVPKKDVISADDDIIVALAKEFYGEAIDRDSINPADIVDSAGIYDDIEFIDWLDDRRFFIEVSGIITRDGAVFFDLDNCVEVNLIKD